MVVDLINMLSYIWIIRCSGEKKLDRYVEYKIINEPPSGIIPLAECIREDYLRNYYNRLKNKFGEVWVELPYYLTEQSNRHHKYAKIISQRYVNNPEQFFINNKAYVDIPVVSAPFSYNFDTERDTLNKLKSEFDKIAVRVRVPEINITPTMKTSFNNLLKDMRKSDILLLDVFRFSSIESQIIGNINKMNSTVKDSNIAVYILNVFETKNENCHNFSPVIAYYFDMLGFGDFATEERYKGKGGGGHVTVKIRYYDPYEFTLWFFTALKGGFSVAKQSLINSVYWSKVSTTTHQNFCNPCSEVAQGLSKNDQSYWKRFKIIHYINCLVNETATRYTSSRTPEDFDPEGYNLIIKALEGAK